MGYISVIFILGDYLPLWCNLAPSFIIIFLVNTHRLLVI